MGYLDLWGHEIGRLADEAGIQWSICASDGSYLYAVTTVDENGTPSRSLFTPGKMARAVGAPSFQEFYGTRL